MGRAPNPGAPQRVSAHVVPKVPSFSTDDEEEKTTIESGGWEEEPSTTVEQGEVADKIRALGVEARRPNTNITSTNGSGSVTDEPTVDDQRGAAALAMLPPPVVARLVITQGNDSGRTIEVRPGKTYTIGRGIDNDVVLTDIAVSRKHFDLRHDNGEWILADRGSGNGTLVNNRLEDVPFILASGDLIEIGNTGFRFDIPNGVPRSQASYDSTEDDSELSTVSGKPLREPESATPQQIPGPATTGASARPKTLPPPAPLPRPRTQSGRPAGYGPGPISQSHPQPPLPTGGGAPLPTLGPASMAVPPLAPLAPAASVQQASQPLPIQLQPQPQTTLPLPQMANRPPLAPSMLADLPLAAPLASALSQPVGAQPTTIPGQGPPVPATRSTRLPFSYPSAPELPQPPQATPNGTSRPQVAVVAALPGRDATTALVPPMSYAGQPAQAPPLAYTTQQQLSRRMKMALGAAAIALIAAVATIAIIKGTRNDRIGPNDPNNPNRDPRSTSAGTPGAGRSSEPPRDPAVVKAIDPARLDAPRPTRDRASSSKVPPAPVPPASATPAAPPQPATSSAPSSPSSGPSGVGPVPTSSPNATPATTPPAVRVATPAAPGIPQAPPAPGSTASTATAPSRVAGSPASPAAPAPAAPVVSTAPARVPPPPTPPPTARTEPIAPQSVVVAKPDTPSKPSAGPQAPQAPQAPPAATTSEIKSEARNDARNESHNESHNDTRNDRKQAGKRPEKKPETRHPSARSESVRADSERTEKAEVAAARNDKRRGGRSMLDVKNDATALYHARNFGGAATLVTSSLSSFSGDDAQELKNLAAIYSQLGKAYAVGMAPATKPTDAFVALRRAVNFDHDVGGAFTAELQERLIATAPRAAGSYMAAKEFESAFQAVRVSENLGSTSPSNKTIRGMLEGIASDLLRAAQGEMASDPESAKKKLRQILSIVDSKHPIFIKAQKLLTGP
ncbi:MAG TPA: FHA domain-containing protein [Kofleriaceae bacterium]|nr:FHA domain-containing protein [Kofleriaceae bacterium]